MPVQTQMSSFAKKMGGKVAAANAEHKDKPVDAGRQRLPAGIKNGVAKLVAANTAEYKEGDNKGKTYFRAAGVVVTPEAHAGQTVAGQQTSIIITMDDVPAKGMRKGKTFSENYFEFQNVFKMLGIAAPNETPHTDPTGQKTEAYYFAAMKALVARGPYFSFSTRGWTPNATPAQPNPTEMVFEEWHGLADYNGQHDPAAAVNEAPSSPADMQPEPFTEPPQGGAAPPPADAPADPADEVASLVEVAMNDPDGATDDGAAASARLEELAWAAGATKEQTAGAKDWAEVAEMALGIIPTTAAPPAAAAPTIGSKHKFAKRSKDGAKLKDGKGTEFPPQDVEVTSVTIADRTCTVKACKDGKNVVDIRSKQPVAVKFEWLE